MKETVRRLTNKTQHGHIHLASFFFDSQANNDLHRSTTGLFRSLLYQLLPKSRQAMANAVDCHRLKVMESHSTTVIWTQEELAQMFQELFVDVSWRTIILIDALDECDDRDSTLWLVNFFHDLVSRDGVRLNMCLATRHFGAVPLQNCAYIVAEQANGSAIRRYINKTLSRYQRRDAEFSYIENIIEKQARGSFLWVVLVTDRVARNIIKGKRNPVTLEDLLLETPRTIMELYEDLVAEKKRRGLLIQILRWAVLAKGLTLGEWRYLLPFLRGRPPSSFSGCQSTDLWGRKDEDLEDLICYFSRGLVRVSERATFSSPTAGPLISSGALQHNEPSLLGRAGSLDSGQGETRIVSVIHRSVVEFFLQSNRHGGLTWMGGARLGHLAILETCVTLIAARDLDELVDARIQNGPPDSFGCYSNYSANESAARSGSSVVSFSSASQRRHRRVQSSTVLLKGPNAIGKGRKNLVDNGSQTELFQYLSVANHDQSDVNQRDFRLRLLLDHGDGLVSPSTTTQGFGDDLDISMESAGHAPVRVLREYPEILNYALSELSFHAKELQKLGATPIRVIERLWSKDEALWKRWLCLNEKVSYDMRLEKWVSSQGLNTWVDYLALLMEHGNEQPFREAGYHYTDTNHALLIKPSTEDEIEFYERATGEYELSGWLLPYYTTVRLQDNGYEIARRIEKAMRGSHVSPEIRKSVNTLLSSSLPSRFHQATILPRVIATHPDINAREQALVLENATFGYREPSVMTVQLGPLNPATETELGFRITGIRTYDEGVNSCQSVDQNFDSAGKEDIIAYLKHFTASASYPKETVQKFGHDLLNLRGDIRLADTLPDSVDLLFVYGKGDFQQMPPDNDCPSPRVVLFGFSHTRQYDAAVAWSQRHLTTGIMKLANCFAEIEPLLLGRGQFRQEYLERQIFG